ncbi:MAG: DUF308 domain-containing protein [Eubacteriales bacterium]|nr:DUF308 domain-containing protein [Eubacteriales bacterium]
MKFLKQHTNHIILCFFEALVGILLLINPIGFTSGIITAGGVLLLLVGIASIIKYFRAETSEAAASQSLTKGLTALLAGAFCVLRYQWFLVTFPALTILYGVVILVTGLGKIQAAIDMLRQKNNRWFLAAISAVVSLACAVVILNNPFSSTVILWTFTGISLIVEAIFDVVAIIVSGKQETI